MIVDSRSKPSGLLPAVEERIQHDVVASLAAIKTSGNDCVVNDTVWYSLKGGTPKPCVVNSADYFSRKFVSEIHGSYGWEKEKTIEDQRIDAFFKTDASGSTFSLTNENFRKLIIAYWAEHPEMDIAEISRIDAMYCKRKVYGIPDLPDKFKRFFSPASEGEKVEIKVGLEFETGNISSAFRAFSKLSTLYSLGEIDLGVFITTNRASARRIWPVSNRNGSYEELENRRYKSNIHFPLWEFLFQPDRYESDAGYLKSDGTLYVPIATEKVESYGNKSYRIFHRSVDSTSEILLPLDASESSVPPILAMT